MKFPSMTRILAIGSVLAVSVLMGSWRHWKRCNMITLSILEDQNADDDIAVEYRGERFDKLPPVVQRYFQTVLPTAWQDEQTTIKAPKAVRIQQEGTMNLGDGWVPYHATQYMSARHANIGFLWDATILLPVPSLPWLGFPLKLEIPVKVRDVYANGTGALEARLLGIVPLARAEANPHINEGELIRWLSEAVLIPTALLPSQYLQWKGMDKDGESQAQLYIRDAHSGGTATITVSFDDKGLIKSVQGVRPKSVSGDFVDALWEGHIYDYQRHQGMLVPTQMDAGWWSNEKLDLYFKGRNNALEYEY